MPSPGTLRTAAPRHSPHRLRIAAAAFALAIVTIASTAGTAFAWDNSAFSTGDEQLLLSLTNQDRSKAGLGALVNDAYLHKEAEWRAKDMGDNAYFSHNIPPTNNQVFTYMQNDGYCFKSAGENIGYSTYDDDIVTANIEVAFMASPGHRANILGAWAHIGVGAYKAADGKKLYAVLFSVPCGATVTTPAPVATARVVRAPTPAPTRKSAAKAAATASPTAQPTASPSPSPTPSPEPTATASPIPTLSPSPTAGETAQPQGSPPAATQPVGAATSLRVHENTASRGLLDSLFSTLFGGLFAS
jgi:uncharacterized protein YkwD